MRWLAFFPSIVAGLLAAGLAEARPWPSKVISLKVGTGAYVLEGETADEVCGSPAQALGQFGLQTAHFPWTVHGDFYTDISFELFGGAFLPAFPLGQGWVVFTAGAQWRASGVERPVEGSDCGGTTGTSTEDSLGLGGGVEYLLFDGNLGFQLEARQAFIGATSTWIGLGVNVSPLLWLVWRNQ